MKTVSDFRRKKFLKMVIDGLALIGYIDSSDAIHSIEYFAFESTKFHEDSFGCHLCKWRWDFENGISSFGGISREHRDLVKSYLIKKYGMRFNENGQHDKEWMISVSGFQYRHK